jgi:hypothetical protein
VVSRLAHRHGIQVRLSTTGFAGVTAAVVLPASVFVSVDAVPAADPTAPGSRAARRVGRVVPQRGAVRLPDEIPEPALPAWEPLPPQTVEAWDVPAPAPQPAPVDAATRWPEWWRDDAAQQAPDPPEPDLVDLREPELARRVPQRNLSPHLRRNAGGESGRPPEERTDRADRTGREDPHAEVADVPLQQEPPDRRRAAADALSRYQASRRAALRSAGRRPHHDDSTQEGPAW